MEKLQFIQATAFPDKHSSSINHHPVEILVPVEAIACLKKNLDGRNSYSVLFKANYPFSLPFPASSVEASIDASKIEIL